MKKTKNDSDDIGSREAAKILDVHPGTLANWRCLKVGPEFRKVGDGPRGYVVYSRNSIRAFKKQMRRKLARG